MSQLIQNTYDKFYPNRYVWVMFIPVQTLVLYYTLWANGVPTCIMDRIKWSNIFRPTYKTAFWFIRWIFSQFKTFLRFFFIYVLGLNSAASSYPSSRLPLTMPLALPSSHLQDHYLFRFPLPISWMHSLFPFPFSGFGNAL